MRAKFGGLEQTPGLHLPAKFHLNVVSDIAIFVLKRDVKLQLTNSRRNVFICISRVASTKLRCVMLLHYANEVRWCVTVRCSTLRCVTDHSGTLRHVALRSVRTCYGILRHVTVRYGASRYLAVRYGSLLNAAVLRYGAIRHVTARCDTLQHVMVCSRALQHVTEYCGMLRSIAACTLQHVTVRHG